MPDNNAWLKRESRRLTKARLLLPPALGGAAGIWADLGCGDGIFTVVLQNYLQPGSIIYAIDRDRRALQKLRHNCTEGQANATLYPVQADFTQPLDLPPLNGLVIANALHFVKRKQAVVTQLAALLRPDGRFVVIEYNTHCKTSSVPYPLDEFGFLKLAKDVGLKQAQIASRAPSTYLGEMYAGVALRT